MRLKTSEALNQAIREEMSRNPRVIVLGEDIRAEGGLFGVSTGLLEEFGADRVIDTPISEAGFCGFGIGAAMNGWPAVVEIQIFDFVALAIDQICNHAAKMHYMSGGQFSVPLVVRGPCAAGTGLAAQHSQSLEGWFLEVAGLKVVTPATAADAKGLLKAAIRDPDPVLFLEHRLLYDSRDDIPDGDYVIRIGSARVIREGSDVSVIANSIGVRAARGAAQQLAGLGIDAEVVDLRTVKPLDVPTIAASVRKTGRAVVVSGGSATAGLTAHVTQCIISSDAFDYLEAPIQTVGMPDIPAPFARELEDLMLPQPGAIVDKALVALGQPPLAGTRPTGVGRQSTEG